MKKIYALLICSFLLKIEKIQAQQIKNNSDTCNKTFLLYPPENIKFTVQDLGRCQLYRKNGTKVSKIKVWEIHDAFIVFEKGGNLHDIMKDEIDKIETELRPRMRKDYGGTITLSIVFDKTTKKGSLIYAP